MAAGDREWIGDGSLMMATFQKEGCTPDAGSCLIEGVVWIEGAVAIVGWVRNGGEVHQAVRREEEANSLHAFLIAEPVICLDEMTSEIIDLVTI